MSFVNPGLVSVSSSEPSLQGRLSGLRDPLPLASVVAALVAIATGAFLLAGWPTGLAWWLAGHHADDLTVTAASALALLSAGTSLLCWLAGGERPALRQVARGSAIAVVIIGIDGLAFAAGLAPLADAWAALQRLGGVTLGRSVYPVSGAAYVLLGLALATLDVARGARAGVAEQSAIVATAVLTVPVIGLLAGPALPPGLAEIVSLPPAGAIALGALLVGVLAARASIAPETPETASARAAVSRALPLPAPLLLVLILGAGLAAAHGQPLLTGLLLTAGLAMLWQGIRAYDRVHADLSRQEAALREAALAKAHLTALAEATSDSIVSITPDGLVASWNPGAERIFGFSAAEMIGRPLETLVPDARRGEFAYLIQQLLKGSPVHDYATTRRRKDGREIHVSLSCSPIRDAACAIAGVTMIARDITTRKNLEAELSANEAKFRGIVEIADAAIMIVGRDDRIEYANLAIERLLGQPRCAMLGACVSAVAPAAAATADAARRGPVAIIHPDGREVLVESESYDLALSEGLFTVWMLRDVTERVRASEAIVRGAVELERVKELARIRDHVFSSLSHEIKTPLSLIQGYAELIEDAHPDDEFLAGLREGVDRLQTQLTNVLDYAAVLGGHLAMSPVELDLREILDALPYTLEAPLQAKALQFTMEVPDAPLVVDADGRRLGQALGLLLDNAIKFTPEQGALGVRATRTANEVRITIWDSGPGIAPDVRARVWEAFGQADLGDSQRKGGIGLGLPLAYRIVAMHGGRLEMQSLPGSGAAFTVVLPTLAIGSTAAA